VSRNSRWKSPPPPAWASICTQPTSLSASRAPSSIALPASPRQPESSSLPRALGERCLVAFACRRLCRADSSPLLPASSSNRVVQPVCDPAISSASTQHSCATCARVSVSSLPERGVVLLLPDCVCVCMCAWLLQLLLLLLMPVLCIARFATRSSLTVSLTATATAAAPFESQCQSSPHSQEFYCSHRATVRRLSPRPSPSSSPRPRPAPWAVLACGGGTSFSGNLPRPLTLLLTRPIFSLPFLSPPTPHSHPHLSFASQRTHFAAGHCFAVSVKRVTSRECAASLLLLAWPRSSLRGASFRLPRSNGWPVAQLATADLQSVHQRCEPDRPAYPRTRAQDPLATRFFSVDRLEINQPSLSTARPVDEPLSIDSIPTSNTRQHIDIASRTYISTERYISRRRSLPRALDAGSKPESWN